VSNRFLTPKSFQKLDFKFRALTTFFFLVQVVLVAATVDQAEEVTLTTMTVIAVEAARVLVKSVNALLVLYLAVFSRWLCTRRSIPSRPTILIVCSL
jgi:hypothetical protein